MPDNTDSTGDTPVSRQGYDYDFLQALTAVKANTEALTTLIPKEFAKLSTTLTDVYKTAGPSRGTAARLVPSISGASSLTGMNDATARAQLAGQDVTEAEVEGNGNTMGGATWRDRQRPGGLGQILPMPRFPGAAPNTNDLLNYLSTVSANMAGKRQATLDTRQEATNAAKYDEAFAATGGDFSQVTQKQLDAMTEEPNETKVGKISDAFAGLENAYAQGKYIKGIISRITEPAAAMRNYGYQTGYSGGSSPLFLGLRSPFDGGAMSGLGQRFSQLGFALANNVSPPQAADIYNNLFSRGWYGGGSTNDMRTAAATIMRNRPDIGSMPATYDMMDKATRQGATSLTSFVDAMKQVPDAAKAAHTSITDTMAQMDALGMYNTTIGGTYMGGMQNALAWQSVTGQPTAFMQQLMQNPLVVGQTFAATGLMPQMQGLASPFQHMEGIMGSLNMLNRAINVPGPKSYRDPITGLSQQIGRQKQKEALMASILHVPQDFLHSMLANQTGIMHGSEVLNAGQTYSSSIMSSVQQGKFGDAYNALTGSPYHGIQSAMKDAVDSQGHHMFEDWSTFRSLKAKGRNDAQAHWQAQWMARNRVINAGDTAILKDATQGQLLAAEHQEHLEAQKVSGAQRGRINGSVGLGHLSPEQRAKVAMDILHSGTASGKMMTDVSKARAAQMEAYIRGNTQKFGGGSSGNNGPKLQIELGPAARKVLHLSDPTGQQKANANAGSASINLNSYVNGATAAPYPNLDTAGTAATANSGGPADFTSAMGG